MKLFILFLFTIPLIQTALAGGTVVGDGGYLVVCKKSLQFLDVFEGHFYRKLDISPEYNPGDFNYHDGQTEIDKIASIYRLPEEQIEILRSISKAFFNRHYDPWQRPSSFAFIIPSLTAKPVHLMNAAADEIRKNKCFISPIAIKVDQDKDAGAESLCGNFFFSKDKCLLVDQRTFHKLTFLDQKCLFVHEMLRYTPAFKSIAPAREIDLRETTLNLCLD